MELKDVIAPHFYNANHGPHPRAATVGELVALLELLPSDLPVRRYGEPVTVVVYNINSDAHLGIEETEPDDE